jgi:hypothetical protein
MSIQVLYGLIMDLIVQCAAPLLVYLCRALQSDDLDDMQWTMHPYDGEERLTIRPADGPDDDDAIAADTKQAPKHCSAADEVA